MGLLVALDVLAVNGPNNRLHSDPQKRRGFGGIYRLHLAAFAGG